MQALRWTMISMVVGTSLLAGCKKKEEGAPKESTKGGGETTKEAKPAGGPDFSKWDVAGKKKAWTGSWVAKDNGSWQAWTVGADGKVQVQEGEEAKSFTLEVEAPCYAYFANDKGMKFPHPFTVLPDGKIKTSGDGGGYRKGADAIYCDGSGKIFEIAGGKCTLWEDDFGKWKSAAGDCSLAGDVFKHADPNGGEFKLEGDSIVAGSNPTESVADHEAAKTAAAAKNAAK
jgi:hypothetical protein